MAKSKKSGGKLSFSDLDHGKKVGAGTAMHLGKLGHKNKGKGHGTGSQVSGHVDPWQMAHDAKGHEKGSRGPFTSASAGKSKSKD